MSSVHGGRDKMEEQWQPLQWRRLSASAAKVMHHSLLSSALTRGGEVSHG